VKVGDIVRCEATGAWSKGGEIAVVVNELQPGSSYVEIMLDGKILTVNIRHIRQINENR